jgi:hypothetical protein
MAATTTATDAKRAKPQLNVYTALLTVSLLLAILGSAVDRDDEHGRDRAGTVRRRQRPLNGPLGRLS